MDGHLAISDSETTSESLVCASSKKTKSKAADLCSSGSKSCKVCGDSALNVNFGAISCESCKAFFRRNALRKKEYRCPFQNDCKVDLESRRWCQKCRLQKCFTVGMKAELIQKVKRANEADDSKSDLPDEKPVKKKAAKIPKKKKTDSTPSPSPLKSPDSFRPSSAESSSTFAEIDFAASGQLEFLSKLSSFERDKILELVKANEVMNENSAEDEIAVVRYRERQSLVDVINMTDIAIRRLIKMSKKIDGFKELSQEDQIALLKGACFEMMILRAVSHYDPEKDCWQGPRKTMIKVDVLKEVRGNVHEEIKAFIHGFSPELRRDQILLLILGAIALFHPDRLSLHFRGQIKAQQSLYYFLLRSYITAKYHTMDADQTEALYLEMITKIDVLHLLNTRHISMFMEVNPKDVEPLLIEIFDLKSGQPSSKPPSVTS